MEKTDLSRGRWGVRGLGEVMVGMGCVGKFAERVVKPRENKNLIKHAYLLKEKHSVSSKLSSEFYGVSS